MKRISDLVPPYFLGNIGKTSRLSPRAHEIALQLLTLCKKSSQTVQVSLGIVIKEMNSFENIFFGGWETYRLLIDGGGKFLYLRGFQMKGKFGNRIWLSVQNTLVMYEGENEFKNVYFEFDIYDCDFKILLVFFFYFPIHIVVKKNKFKE